MNPYLRTPLDLKINLSPSEAILEKGSKRKSVTPDIAYLLLSSNGLNTLEDILISMKEREIFNPQIIDSLISLYSQGFIEFLDLPCERKVHFTGSFKSYYPKSITIELTNACNLRCLHCYGSFTPTNTSYIDIERLKLILEEAKSTGVESVELTGGECTLHPDFNEILRFCLNKFAITGILSNGININKETIDMLKNTHKNNYILQIDLDGSTKEIHEFIRGRNSFDKTINTLKLLKRNMVKFRVVMNLHQGNIEDLEGTAKLAYDLGAESFHSSPILDIGRASSNIDFLKDEAHAKSLETLKRIGRYYPNSFILDEIQLNKDRFKDKGMKNCGAGWGSLAISANGEAKICQMASTNEVYKQNILEKGYLNSIKELPTIFFHDLKPPNNELCNDCRYKNFCKGCIVRALSVNERYFKNERCPYIQKNLNKV